MEEKTTVEIYKEDLSKIRNKIIPYLNERLNDRVSGVAEALRQVLKFIDPDDFPNDEVKYINFLRAKLAEFGWSETVTDLNKVPLIFEAPAAGEIQLELVNFNVRQPTAKKSNKKKH